MANPKAFSVFSERICAKPHGLIAVCTLARFTMTKRPDDTQSDGRPDYVSISDCAKRLTDLGDVIDRSGLSRYCADHGLKLGKMTGILGVAVDFDAVRHHRAENYRREIMTGGTAVPPADAKPAPKPAKPATPRPPAPSASADVLEMDPKRRETAAKAEKAELELAKAKGELAEIIDIDAGLADALASLRQSAQTSAKQAASDAAADLGVPPDQIRGLTVRFKSFYRDLEAQFIADMAALTAEAREPRSRACARLDELAVMALKLRRVAPGASVRA